jgi:hypothetical protein
MKDRLQKLTAIARQTREKLLAKARVVRLIWGNDKLGPRIQTASLLPVVTCDPNAPCSKAPAGRKRPPCYACKFTMRRSVADSWNHNTKIAKRDPWGFWASVAADWEWVQPRFFRFGVAGDCPSPEFIAALIAFAARFPTTRILVFTKRYSWWNAQPKLPRNLSVVYSAWPGFPMDNPHKRPVAWMFWDKHPDDRIPNTARPCLGACESCMACWGLGRGKSVVFDKH